MAIVQEIRPTMLVVWSAPNVLQGIAYYENVVFKDGDKVVSTAQGEAQPVAVLGQKGIDLDGIIGKIGVAAVALAEQKDAELRAAQADVQRLTDERDGLQSRVAALDAEANALRAENEALKAPKPIMRVPTAALLIVVERRELTAQLDAILAALPEEQQREFDLYLKMPYTRRDHPLVAMVQQAFGWTDAEVDALFAEADAV
jgi:hypothetical protein